MSELSLWLMGFGVLLIAELLTGTFYLLMLALGLLAASAVAAMGFSLAAQMSVAAVVGMGAVLFWYLKRGKNSNRLNAHSNPDVNPDIGRTVEVKAWSDEGKTQVFYRGANWEAVLQHKPHSQRVDGPGEYQIVEVLGNTLILEKSKRFD